MSTPILRALRALLPSLLLVISLPSVRSDTIADRKSQIVSGHVTSPYPSPSSTDPSTAFIARAAYALAAYASNTNLSQADTYIISLHDDSNLVISNDSIILNPSEIPCFFAMPLLVRTYLDPTLRSRMSATAAGDLRELLYWFINYRSVCTDADPSKLWTITYTENHNAIRKSSYYLIAQALMNDASFGPNFALGDGHTIQQHYYLWNAYWKEFLRQTAREGIDTEIASPQYEKYTVACWYNLRDYAQDAATAAQADQFLTLYWSDVANDFAPGATIRGGAGLRMYQNTYLTQGTMYSFRPWLYMYDWHGTYTGASSHPEILCAATSPYVPPALVRACAINENGSKAPYAYASRRWGRQGATATAIVLPSSIRRDTWWTPDYVMGAMTYDSTQTYANISAQNRFFLTTFNSGVNDRIVVKGWGTYASNLGEFFGVTGACDHDVIVAARDLDSSDPNVSTNTGTRLFLGGALATNQTTDASGWIFSSAGSGYVGIWVSTGGYTWDTTTTTDGVYLDLSDSWAPVVIQCGQASNYASFAAFKASLIANSPTYSADVLTYLSQHGDTFSIARQSASLPTLNGSARPQNPTKVYDSPYLQGVSGADTMTISYPGYADCTLDFNYTTTLFDYAVTTGYVTANQSLRLDNGANWTSGARPFSTAPLAPASGYSGPTFYGGFAADGTTAGSFTLAQVRNGSSSDAPRVQFTTSAAGAGSFSVLMATDLAQAVPLSTLLVSGQSNRSSGTGHAGNLYVAVKIGSNWYINNAPTVWSAISTSYSYANLQFSTWSAYSPGTSLTFPGAGAITLDGSATITAVALLNTMSWGASEASGINEIVDLIALNIKGTP